MTPTEARSVHIVDQNDTWLREQIHKASFQKWSKWLNAAKDRTAFVKADDLTQRFVLMCASHFICQVTSEGKDASGE